MQGGDQLEPYVHAARNCTQMLHAIDRRMARALEALEAGNASEAKQLLAMLKEALPQAIEVIDHDSRMKDAD